MLNLKSLILIVLISLGHPDNNCLVYFEYCEEKEEPYQVKMANCNKGYLDESGEEICTECNSGFARSNDYKSCTKIESTIDNCIKYYLSDEELYCYKCKDGYLTSDNGKKCRESKNCYHFSLNNKGEEICDGCETGYALSYDKKSCKKFENCYQLAEENTKCDKCDEYFHPNAEGKCERTQCKTYDDTDKVCTECYEGYDLNDDKKCEKITIENCLKLGSNKEKCITCLGGISPDANGKCNLPSTLIKGCTKYKDNGECTECEDEDEDYKLTGGTCKFIDCKDGEYKIEYCALCKAGYYLEEEDDSDNEFCMGYDGSRDTSSDSSARNKVEFALLIFILALLI